MNKKDEDLIIVAILITVGYFAYTKGYLTPIIAQLQQLFNFTPTPATPITPTTPTTPGGSVDEDGVQWFYATGEKTIIEQSRTDANDHRWSGNVSGLAEFGYEATMIVDFTGASVSGDGHFAKKMWGPNHSGGEECCWYDFGIRSDGEVQTQIEQPHPSNSDVPCPGCVMDNIGIGMQGSIIGLKWLVAPLTPGGSSSNGGIRLAMWVDKNALTNGVPSNNWELVLDGVDNGEILNSGYQAPDEQDMEIRISDTDGEEAYMGLHVKKLEGVPAATASYANAMATSFVSRSPRMGLYNNMIRI